MKIPVVNREDEIIEYKEREDCNLDHIVRISGIWITDEEGNILLQQRKFSKKYNPGKWSPAVGGTLEEGETYESNAYKEMEEELGLKDVPLTLVKKIYSETQAGKKFMQIYTAQISKEKELIIQEDEVEQVKWFTKEELEKALLEDPDNFVASMHTTIRELFL